MFTFQLQSVKHVGNQRMVQEELFAQTFHDIFLMVSGLYKLFQTFRI